MPGLPSTIFTRTNTLLKDVYIGSQLKALLCRHLWLPPATLTIRHTPEAPLLVDELALNPLASSSWKPRPRKAPLLRQAPVRRASTSNWSTITRRRDSKEKRPLVLRTARDGMASCASPGPPCSPTPKLCPTPSTPTRRTSIQGMRSPLMRVQEPLAQPFFMHLLTYTPPPDLLDSEDPDTDEINCVNSRIRSIPDLRLERFPQVRRLRLRQNLIQRIEGLSVLAGTLTDLEFYDNLISHISGLDDLTNLTSLDLSYNKIKHIKNVNHLINLTDLYFVSNKISRIEGLDGLNQLRNLELASNRIRKLENLDALPALEQLWLASNKITELTGLGALTNLRLLSVQSNRIRDLSPLKELPQLEELYMSHNGLASLEGLESNTKLRVLEISNNQITNLKALVPLLELEDVWASYNQISEFSDVEQALADKKALTTVYFEGNPLQLKSPALYRNKVKMALPQIQQIDASMCPPSPPNVQSQSYTHSTLTVAAFVRTS